jgi:hypothetical protein
MPKFFREAPVYVFMVWVFIKHRYNFFFLNCLLALRVGGFVCSKRTGVVITWKWESKFTKRVTLISTICLLYDIVSVAEVWGYWRTTNPEDYEESCSPSVKYWYWMAFTLKNWKRPWEFTPSEPGEESDTNHFLRTFGVVLNYDILQPAKFWAQN